MSLVTATHTRTIDNPPIIGITSVHGRRIVNDDTTIIASRTTGIDQTTDDDQTKAVIGITMTDIEKTIITTDKMTTGMTIRTILFTKRSA